MTIWIFFVYSTYDILRLLESDVTIFQLSSFVFTVSKKSILTIIIAEYIQFDTILYIYCRGFEHEHKNCLLLTNKISSVWLDLLVSDSRLWKTVDEQALCSVYPNYGFFPECSLIPATNHAYRLYVRTHVYASRSKNGIDACLQPAKIIHKN